MPTKTKQKSNNADLLMAAIFVLGAGIGWLCNHLIIGAIIGIGAGLAAMFIYKKPV